MHQASTVPGKSSSAFQCLAFSVTAGLCVLAFYWFKTASSLREENRQLRENLTPLEQAENTVSELEVVARELRQARHFDSYKIEQLEAEVSKLRAYSNAANQRAIQNLEKQLRYARLQQENAFLKARNQRLEQDLSGKPMPPRAGGWLGLGIMAATQENNDPRSETGVVVTHVMEGSPGADSMLRVKDVVLSIDGEPVPDPAAFKNIMAQKEVGKQVVFDVLRTDGLVKILVNPREWPQRCTWGSEKA